MSEHIPADLRRRVSERARQCCEYCRTMECFSSDPLTVDHIIPRSLSGRTESFNLALACHGCNQHKATRVKAVDPATGEEAGLFDPRRHHWEDHFGWTENFTLIVGLTPTGRSTIAALKLNRAGLVNLRRVLYSINAHPPGPSQP